MRSFARNSILFVFLFLLLNTEAARAQGYTYNYSERCSKAYRQYMSLNLSEGTELIKQEIRANPYNLMATYLADYEDCLLLLFNGDKNDMDQRKAHFDQRIDILERGDKKSPWYRMCRAGMYMHWAFVYIRFGDNYKAAMTFRKSYILLKENKKQFPDFVYDDIFFGLEDAIIGTLPDDYKWIVSIFGMKGNVKRGVKQIEQFINTHNVNDMMYGEAVMYYVYLKFYLMSDQQDVWNFVNSNKMPVQDNLFNQLIRINIALNYRKADIAMQTLKIAQAQKGYNMFPVFDYEMGAALLAKLDPASVKHFQKFLSHYNGRFFVKDAWQKITYGYYLQGDRTNAQTSREKIKTEGNTKIDADKQALRFAESGEWPNITLLQARLLTDGGYYNEALSRMSQVMEKNFTAMSEKLEYYFRLARIYDELGKDAKAVGYYNTVISMGRDRKEHFAARSALQMGFMYERMGKKTEAIAKYNECLSMKGHDFQNSIDQQAKAGINRLSN